MTPSIPKSASVLSAHVWVEFHTTENSKESEQLMDVDGSKSFSLTFWVGQVTQYI